MSNGSLYSTEKGYIKKIDNIPLYYLINRYKFGYKLELINENVPLEIVKQRLIHVKKQKLD